MEEDKNQKPNKPDQDDVKLSHQYNYIGGPYAYKNSSKQGKRLDPKNLTELVLMTKPGRASKVIISLPQEDKRSGVFPQHNTILKKNDIDDEDEFVDVINDPNDFINTLELLPSRTLEAYQDLDTAINLKKNNFEKRICTLTKARLEKVKEQFSHLTEFAFNQMLDIPRPDKRDFVVWYKSLSANQIIIVYVTDSTKHSNFAQVVTYDKQKRIRGVRHCSFDNAKPLIINESYVDKYGNLRQIAHMGSKSGSDVFNSAERFDDGTVSWIVSQNKTTGAAVLRPNGEILFVENLINDQSLIAARNLGAEGVIEGQWSGVFSQEACLRDCHPLQETFKIKVRQQIHQIVDGSAIPGLDPVFWI